MDRTSVSDSFDSAATLEAIEAFLYLVFLVAIVCGTFAGLVVAGLARWGACS